MSTFTESEHPRVANGTFTDKEQTAPELSLTSEPEKSHLEAIYDIYIADGGYGPQVARDLAEQHLNDADEAGVPRQCLVDYLNTSATTAPGPPPTPANSTPPAGRPPRRRPSSTTTATPTSPATDTAATSNASSKRTSTRSASTH